MPWSDVPTAVPGNPIMATWWNAYVRDNENYLRTAREFTVYLGQATSFGWDGSYGDHRNFGHGQVRWAYNTVSYPGSPIIYFRAGGRSEASGGTCEVQLYNITDQQVVASFQFPSTAGQWTFNIAQVSLTNGKEYVVRVHNLDGSKLAEGSGMIIIFYPG